MMQSIDSLALDANMLSTSAVEGHLSSRADVSKHLGQYRSIMQGVNDTLDAGTVHGPGGYHLWVENHLGGVHGR